MGLLDRIQNYLSKPVDGTGLAMFRIVYGLSLLGEIGQLFYFRHLIFDIIPYQVPYELDFTYALVMWLAVITCIIVGLHTRIATILHYAFLLVFLATIRSYEYHVFYTHMMLGFLLIFMRPDARFSLDNIRRRLRRPETPAPATHFQVERWQYAIPVFFGIGVTYFDSVFHKSFSTAWQNGLGMWLPGSVANFNHNPWLQPLLNFEYLNMGLGYLTLAFEAAFIFLMWSKRLRPALVIIGMGLHFGIFLFFPIPWFAIAFLGIYLLVIPHHWWGKLAESWRGRHGAVEAAYDPDDDAQVRARSLVDGLDTLDVATWETRTGGSAEEVLDVRGQLPLGALWRLMPAALTQWLTRARESAPVPYGALRPISKRVLVAGMVFFGILQLNATFHSPLGFKAADATGLSQNRAFMNASNEIGKFSKALFGITPHTVFLDFHFFGYNHIIAVAYVKPDGTKEWLPIINEGGEPGWYAYGANWAKVSFRMNSPNIHTFTLQQGLRSFTAFWAHKHEVSLQNAVFELRVKKVELPLSFEEDFLTKQRAKEWMPAGTVRWRNGAFQANIANIEKM